MFMITLHFFILNRIETILPAKQSGSLITTNKLGKSNENQINKV